MQSVSEEFTWLIGGFDAGDGKRGYPSSESLDGLTYNITEDEEDLYIYRIDGKKLVFLPLSCSLKVIQCTYFPFNRLMEF